MQKTRYGSALRLTNPDCVALPRLLSLETPSTTQPRKKRKPSMGRPCMPTHSAITPQFGDPQTPPHFDNGRLIELHVLNLSLPLTCMTQSSLRDRLAVIQWLFSCIEAPAMHVISRSVNERCPRQHDGSSYPLIVHEARVQLKVTCNDMSVNSTEHCHVITCNGRVAHTHMCTNADRATNAQKLEGTSPFRVIAHLL